MYLINTLRSTDDFGTHALMTNPVPPTTCGTQKIPSRTPVRGLMTSCIAGIAVNLSRRVRDVLRVGTFFSPAYPLIQNMDAASSWKKAAYHPSWRQYLGSVDIQTHFGLAFGPSFNVCVQFGELEAFSLIFAPFCSPRSSSASLFSSGLVAMCFAWDSKAIQSAFQTSQTPNIEPTSKMVAPRKAVQPVLFGAISKFELQNGRKTAKPLITHTTLPHVKAYICHVIVYRCRMHNMYGLTCATHQLIFQYSNLRMSATFAHILSPLRVLL